MAGDRPLNPAQGGDGNDQPHTLRANTLNPDELKRVSGDVFGRIYEYFLTQFADQKAHDGGEFFTPISLVSLIAHVLNPEGGTVLDPEIVSGLLRGGTRRSRTDSLTPREREVLDLMAQGHSNRSIARRLVVTERAVEKHAAAIFMKFGLPPVETDNRRVKAVLTYLTETGSGT